MQSPGLLPTRSQKTLFITPDEALVKSLFAKGEPDTKPRRYTLQLRYVFSLYSVRHTCLSMSTNAAVHPILAPCSCSFSSHLCAARAVFSPLHCFCLTYPLCAAYNAMSSPSFLATNSYLFRVLSEPSTPLARVHSTGEASSALGRLFCPMRRTLPLRLTCTKKAPELLGAFYRESVMSLHIQVHLREEVCQGHLCLFNRRQVVRRFTVLIMVHHGRAAAVHVPAATPHDGTG